MIRIKLLADWNGHKANSVLDVDEVTADECVATQVAKLFDPIAEAKEQREIMEARRAEEERIKAAVRAELESSKAFDPARRPIISTHERVDDDPQAGYKSFGDFIHSVRKAASGNMDERLFVTKAPYGMSEGADADGGFLVPTQYRAELMKIMHEKSAIADRCFQLPMTSNSIEIPAISESSRVDGSRSGGVVAYWTEEGGDVSSSKPKFRKIKLTLRKLAALVYGSDELLDDSMVTMQTLTTQLVGDEMAFMLDDAILWGTGAGMPLGVMNSPALVTVLEETDQAADTLKTENILKMWSRLHASSRANAVWLINQDIEPQLFTMSITAGSTGNLTYMPPGGISGAPYGTLMGRPVVPIEQAETVGTKGDIILADFNQYILAQKSSGIQAASSIHVRFVQDETVFRFTMRVDGQPWWNTALTPHNGSNTTSPFVCVETR